MYEVLALVAGIALAVAFWNAPVRLLRISGSAALLLVVLLGALATTGWPLYRVRLHQRAPTPTHSSLQQAHSFGGHLSIWPLALVMPLFLASALRRQSSAWRKGIHLGFALFIGATWLIIGFSGYLLPDQLQNPLPRDIAPTILRFVLLHMFGLPILLAVVLLIVGWRDLRASRQVAAV